MDDRARNRNAGPTRSETPSGGNPDAGRWAHGTPRRAVVHGIRPYDAGAFNGPGRFESVRSSVNAVERTRSAPTSP